MAGETPDPGANKKETTSPDSSVGRQNRLGFAAEMKGGFLDFMQRLRGNRPPEAEMRENATDKKAEKKAKKEAKVSKAERMARRARRFLQHKFESIVPRPEPIKAEDSPVEKSAERLGAAVEPEQSDPSGERPAVPESAEPELPAKAETAAAEPEPETPKTESEPPREETSPEPETTPEPEEPAIPPAAETPEPPTPEPPRRTERGSIPSERVLHPLRGTEAEHVLFDRHREPERIIARDPQARGLATLAGVGVIAEHFGRKRADRNLNKNVKSVDKKVGQGQEQLRAVEQSSAKTAHTAERLDLWQQAFESRRVPERVQVLEQKAADSKEQLKSLMANEHILNRTPEKSVLQPLEHMRPPKIEQAPVPVPAAEAKKPSIEQLMHPVETKTAPETVLKSVEVAADKNVPIERFYEQRHEVKDDPGSSPVAGTAGGGPAGVTSPYVPPTPVPSSLPAPQPQSASQLASQSSRIPPMYRQAAKNGAYGAGVILAALGLAFLL